MNKYERARLLAERAKQLENGSTPTVDITGLDDALRIAQKEMLEGKLPLKIRRRNPGESTIDSDSDIDDDRGLESVVGSDVEKCGLIEDENSSDSEPENSSDLEPESE